MTEIPDHLLERTRARRRALGLPVAEEYKVQMACHPSDPGIGVGVTYRGVDRVLGMSEGFKDRAIRVRERLLAVREAPAGDGDARATGRGDAVTEMRNV